MEQQENKFKLRRFYFSVDGKGIHLYMDFDWWEDLFLIFQPTEKIQLLLFVSYNPIKKKMVVLDNLIEKLPDYKGISTMNDLKQFISNNYPVPIWEFQAIIGNTIKIKTVYADDVIFTLDVQSDYQKFIRHVFIKKKIRTSLLNLLIKHSNREIKTGRYGWMLLVNDNYPCLHDYIDFLYYQKYPELKP